MSQFRIESFSRYGGIAFVVLFLAGVASAGDAGLDDGAKIATYFADHRSIILIGNQVAGVALVCFMLWSWWLMTAFESVDASLRSLAIGIFVSGALIAAVELPVMGVGMTLAVVSDQPVDPGLARAFANAGTVFSCLEYLPQAAFALFLAAAIHRSGIAGAWFVWLSLAMALVALIAAGPSLGLDLPAALLSFGWVIAVNIVMLRSPRLAAAGSV